MYVCGGALAGTVYCTCAHTLPPEIHAAGGLSPFPVSSYTTSTPVAVYTRNTVEPMHDAPAYSALHIDTVNVCPALAVTPHTGSFEMSVLVWLAVNSWQKASEVGARVGVALGSGVGAVGRAVGGGEGSPGGSVGIAVGLADGKGDGLAVVG